MSTVDAIVQHFALRGYRTSMIDLDAQARRHRFIQSQLPATHSLQFANDSIACMSALARAL
jgi:hypothetical protein